ncbi:hypothetical protein [Saccharopolyspora phatthalungensis]|uniref:SAV-6107-like HEPN domain-containing protein n=1 Tax=Saccharopolyspora phatthalungensis TaxID=664693 RepID=A0A840Q6B4_9PSEU|nr:hypothetical protein [Saccharopolyspora phatthalungensis]MBB5154199.1 hypothetical protein [Saccharopolyspora phatthalungensis]
MSDGALATMWAELSSSSLNPILTKHALVLLLRIRIEAAARDVPGRTNPGTGHIQTRLWALATAAPPDEQPAALVTVRRARHIYTATSDYLHARRAAVPTESELESWRGTVEELERLAVLARS